METRILHVVAESSRVALSVARAITKGQLPACGHYETEDLAQAWADHCNGMLGARLVSVWPVAVEVEPGKPPLVTAWPTDKVDDAAAAFLITVVGPLMVGVGTLIEWSV